MEQGPANTQSQQYKPVQLGIIAHPAPAASEPQQQLRSVSSPHPAPFAPPLPTPNVLPRRSSFDSSPVPARAPSKGGAGNHRGHSRSKSSTSTLPSIRSLKTRFQQSFGSTFGRKGPRDIKGDEGKQPNVQIVRLSSATLGEGSRLKGFSGPAGAQQGASDMNRSASLPAKLYTSRGLRDQPPGLPPLVLRVDEIDEFGVKRSVDQALASEYSSPAPHNAPPARAVSPTPPNRPREVESPAGRASPLPGRPIVIAPQSTQSPIPSPFLRNAHFPASPSRARDSPQPRFRPERDTPLVSPGLAPHTAPIPQRTLSPTPASSRRILNRVSQDFTRRPDDPSLSTLRKQQAQERDSVTRTLSRQGHRHSRILPGATLPAEVFDMALVRRRSTVSLGATDSESRRGSTYLAPNAAIDFAVPSESTRRNPTERLQRRHSVSPVVTPKPSQQPDDRVSPVQSSTSGGHPPFDPYMEDGYRGQGLGLGPPPSHDVRRPSKPFPPEFDEVPIQRIVVQQPSMELNSWNKEVPASDEPAFLPVVLGNIPRVEMAPKALDTPPSSARRSSSNPFVPPFDPPPRASSAASTTSTTSSYGAPTEAPPVMESAHTGARPPSLYNPFLPSTRELRQPQSASSTDPDGPRTRDSFVSPVSARADSDSEYEQEMDNWQAEPRALHRSRDDLLAQRRATLAGQSRRLTADARASDGEDRNGRARDAPSRAESGDDQRESASQQLDLAEPSPIVDQGLARELSSHHGQLVRSPGGDSPFQLADYLNNSPAASPPIGREMSRPSRSHIKANERSGAAPSASHDQEEPVEPESPESPKAAAQYSLQPPPQRQDSTASALSLAEMESEIARMEAELTSAWRSPSMYDASSPFDAAMTPGTLRTLDEFESVSPGRSPLAEHTPSDLVTPRTARKWSIIEIEKAYERMKRLLGSSASRPLVEAPAYDPSEASSSADENSLSYADGGFDTSFDHTLAQDRPVRGSEADADVHEVLADRSETAVDDDMFKHGPSSDRSLEHPPNGSFDSADFEAKPLPGLPPPTPSLRSVPSSRPEAVTPPPLPNGAHHEKQDDSGHDDNSRTDHASEPGEAGSEGASGARLHEGQLDDPIRVPTSGVLAEQAAEPQPFVQDAPSNDGQVSRTIPILGRKRADSETGGMRRLVLPAANRIRAKGTRESLLSLVSVEDILAQGDSGEDFATAETDRGAFTTPPTSPSRRGLQWSSPLAARSSPHRLSFGSPLRNGAGRELQRRSAGLDGATMQEQHDSAEAAADGARRISEPPISPPEPRESWRLRRPASSDASTWYPQTPSRLRKDSSVQRNAANLPRSETDDLADDTPASPGRNITIANVRNMDKLEIFFHYTAARVEKEKAVLERDALLDALHETRISLSTIRRERTALDHALTRERARTKKVQEHLGGEPDQYSDRLYALVEGRQAWERRAQEALEALAQSEREIERLRAEVKEGQERQQLLERENMALGAKLAAAAMERDEATPAQREPLSPTSKARSALGSSTSEPLGNLTASALSTAAPSSYATAEVGFSPQFASMSRSVSSATARPAHVESALSPSEAVDGIGYLPAFPVDGRGPKDSHGSTASGLSSSSSSSFDPTSRGLVSLSELAGSPIMGQVLRFHPGAASIDTDQDADPEAKSSYGSLFGPSGSPTRGGSGTTARRAAPLEFVPSHTGYTTFRLPFTDAPSPPMSTRDSEPGATGPPAEEVGERSFDSFDSSVNDDDEIDLGSEGALRKGDEAFLRDLTEEIEEPTITVHITRVSPPPVSPPPLNPDRSRWQTSEAEAGEAGAETALESPEDSRGKRVVTLR